MNGYPFQYSGLDNSMVSIVHGVSKNRTRLSDFHSNEPKASQIPDNLELSLKLKVIKIYANYPILNGLLLNIAFPVKIPLKAASLTSVSTS